jgi:hypothetical protein
MLREEVSDRMAELLKQLDQPTESYPLGQDTDNAATPAKRRKVPQQTQSLRE